MQHAQSPTALGTEPDLSAPSTTPRRTKSSKGYPQHWLSRQERAVLVTRSVPIALSILVLDFALYFGTVALIVAPIPLYASLALSVVAGLFIGNVFTIGHDCGHQSLTDHAWLNRWIGRLAFVPAAHSLSLWVLSHNHDHHAYTNLRGRDTVWEPMSPGDYRRATPFARALYRLYRGPFGSFPYYFWEFWLKRDFLPLSPAARRHLGRHVLDSAIAILGSLALMALIVAVGHRLSPDRPLWQVWALGWLAPFLCWNWIMGWIIFMHHTHPNVAWYDNERDWTFYRAQILGTVEARLPPLMDQLSNAIMLHNAHHSFPAVPMYRLASAQAMLRKVYTEVIAFRLTPASFLRVTRACKLYDFERRQWVDFDGKPTGPAIPLAD